MRKVLSVITCGMLAACSCSDNQWEEVDNVVFDDVTYEEQAQPAPVVEEKAPVYVEKPVYDAPYTEVQPAPCYQPQPCPCQVMMVAQPQPCGCQPMPQPKPKITTTKKIITTTTTIREDCGEPVCKPIVTTHEEVIPSEVSYGEYQPQQRNSDVVEVTVEKNPYRSEIIGMKSTTAKVDAATAAKYSPEAYDVLATRATNRMLQDTAAIYDAGKTKTIYVKETKLLSSDLPYGSHRLRATTKDIVDGSKTFEVVNNVNNADFIAETSSDWFVSSSAAPALQYKLSLFDRSGRKINEWVEILRPVQK
jgi:hypothetical protein